MMVDNMTGIRHLVGTYFSFDSATNLVGCLLLLWVSKVLLGWELMAPGIQVFSSIVSQKRPRFSEVPGQTIRTLQFRSVLLKLQCAY